MPSHASVAARVRADKDAHPERYCAVRGCLWRILTRQGFVPCRKHPDNCKHSVKSA